MNNFNAIKNTFFWGLFSCALLSNVSCVNKVEDEVSESDVPITFSVKTKKVVTKVDNNSFEVGDKVGLYAMLSGETIEGQRYINNLALTCTENSQLIPERVVFYPEGDATLDFVSYYPYQQNTIDEGSKILHIDVKTDQDGHSAFSQSDFMVAVVSKVESSPEPVELVYEHQLTKLDLSLQPMQGEDVKDMLEADPRIVAVGFQTEADFDLQEHTFSNGKNVKDIVVGGTWEVSDGKLIGKEIIVIPQEINNGQKFQIEWNGRIYDCPLPTMDRLEVNTQYSIVVNATQSATHTLEGIVASIKDWPSEIVQETTENEDGITSVHLSVLSFEKSNIYQVHLGGRPVAEICKEYLISPALTATAITVYPTDEKGKADLTQGTVLQILDNGGNINGGSIAWNKEDNSFEYVKGTLPAIEEIYFDADGKVCIEQPEQPATVNVVNYMIRDTRDGLQEYPVVKIGTQYWMRRNLRATKYQDGTKIVQQDTLKGEPGYFYVEHYDLYFYNGEALMQNEISPEGWEIPSLDDWDILDKYIGGDVSLLKAGDWKLLTEEENAKVADANNLCMFYLYPSGQWSSNGGHINAHKAIGLWSWDTENGKIPDNTKFFTGNSNKMLEASVVVTDCDFYKGLAIRCIKKE